MCYRIYVVVFRHEYSFESVLGVRVILGFKNSEVWISFIAPGAEAHLHG